MVSTERTASKLNYEDQKSLLLFLSKGGKSRKKILEALRFKPKNCNQLSKELKFNWWSIQKHLQILMRAKIIECLEFGYFRFYKLTLKGKQLIEDM